MAGSFYVHGKDLPLALYSYLKLTSIYRRVSKALIPFCHHLLLPSKDQTQFSPFALLFHAIFGQKFITIVHHLFTPKLKDSLPIDL